MKKREEEGVRYNRRREARGSESESESESEKEREKESESVEWVIAGTRSV